MREDSFGGYSIVPAAFTVAVAQAPVMTTAALKTFFSLFKISNGPVIEIVSSSITWSLGGQGQIPIFIKEGSIRQDRCKGLWEKHHLCL